MTDSMRNSLKGIKIFDLRLLNPPSKNTLRFKIYIKCGTEGDEAPKRAVSTGNYDNTCIIWNEQFIFPGDITDDTVLKFIIQSKRFIKNTTIGSCERRVIDLFEMQRSSGSCNLDVAEECQLTFNIEKMSELGIVSGVVEQASVGLLLAQKAPAEAANVINPAMQADHDNEKTWTSFIDTFQAFMKVMDGVSEINLYLKVAWNILSLIPKTIIAKKNRDDKVKQLCEKLKDIYEYIMNVERLRELFATAQSTTQWSTMLSTIVRQTIECAHFIRAYSMENAGLVVSQNHVMMVIKPDFHALVKNVMKGINGSVDDKIQSFYDKLDHLMKVMTDSVDLETSVVTLRVSEEITELRELTLLGEMHYDSEAGFFPSKECLPGTQQTLTKWIFERISDESSSQILVVSGQAGVGKSAVAHTIAGMFQKQNRLGSMFCFNRSFTDRRNHFFSTISRDLADSDTLWRKELVKVINNNSAVRRKKDAKTQFDELIVRPSKNVGTIGPVVIVVDALNESGDRSEREELLELLFGKWSELPKNYRIIVTTRPEQDIEAQRRRFNIPCKRMDDIETEETRRDIQAYVSKRLEKISPKLDEIDKDWPIILAKRAEGLFQWAHTACQFIDPTVTRSQLIKKKWQTCISSSSLSLYGLYHQIISSQSESQDSDFIEDFKTVVGAITTVREPLSMDALQHIFESIEDIESILTPFGSFFVGVHDLHTPVRPLHTSLFDFFVSERIAEETNKYYIDISVQIPIITLACLKLMNRMLCFNICHLETSHLRNREVPDFNLRVEKAIPLHLSYSCRFWAFHLQSSAGGGELFHEIRRLMDDNLLYYFEALSLLKAVDRGCVAMREIEKWRKDRSDDLGADAVDAWHFGFNFEDIMIESTPHLYLSALPFTPRDSFVSRKYLERYPQLVTFDIGQPAAYPRTIGMTLKHTSGGRLTALAFSPRGEYAAAGTTKGGFWVWNYKTGDQSVRESHSKAPPLPVAAVAFSRDGELVYCCFKNGDILISSWNTGTRETSIERYGEVIQADSECHGCMISSDGRFVIWSTEKGALLFDRRTFRVVKRFDDRYGVGAISPNGEWVALYGDSVYEVYIWNTWKRTEHVVSCYAWGNLTLTDNYIVSQEHDQAIGIWDVRANTKVAEIQHRSCVTSFHFSPDDQYIIATSGDGMYSIWVVSTGELISRAYVEDLTDCLGFSHDSRLIALRISDSAINIRQWDKSIEESCSNGEGFKEVHEIWLRGTYLILRYDRNHLRISDTRTMNTIVHDVKISTPTLVSVSPDKENVCVAYVTSWGLCLWNEEEGEIVVEKPSNPVIAVLCLDKYLISGLKHTTAFLDYLITTPLRLDEYPSKRDDLSRILTSGPSHIIKIWDICTRQLRRSIYPRIAIRNFLHVRGTHFAISNGTQVEVCECELGDRGKIIPPFPLSPSVTLMANRRHVICMSKNSADILDFTGSKVGSFPFSCEDPEWQLSPDRKYLAWIDNGEIKLLGLDTETSLTGPLLSQPVKKLWFSNDSNQIIAVSRDSEESTGFLDIWDIQSQNMIISTIRCPFNIERIKFLGMSNNGRLVGLMEFSSKYSLWDLDTFVTMSTLPYNTLPLVSGDFNIEGTPESNKAETLNYAIVASEKASLPAFPRSDYYGWILGLHGELLFWVPEKSRKHFWFPGMMHIPHSNITKLNFDNFVHGPNWTKCRSK